MEKVVVTGANGFLGNALCKELIGRGKKVYAVVRKGGKPIDGAIMVECDMVEYHKLKELIPDEFDVLFHFAWTGSAGELRGDYDTQLGNIRHTCELVKVCYEKKCKRFVFASSIMEYEVVRSVGNDMVLGINSIYSTSKMTADYYINSLTSAKYKMDYIRGVISNVYGPGETSPRLINSSIRKMLKGERCSFSPGEQMYDFIYIEDAIKAFIAIAECGKTHKTYYIGSLNPRPLKYFLMEMRDVIDPSIELGIGDMAYNGVSLSYKEFDIIAVKNDTGFVPEHTFIDGIRETVNWIKSID